MGVTTVNFVNNFSLYVYEQVLQSIGSFDVR